MMKMDHSSSLSPPAQQLSDEFTPKLQHFFFLTSVTLRNAVVRRVLLLHAAVKRINRYNGDEVKQEHSPQTSHV